MENVEQQEISESENITADTAESLDDTSVKLERMKELRQIENLCLDFFWDLPESQREELWSRPIGYRQFLEILNNARPTPPVSEATKIRLRLELKQSLYETELKRYGKAGLLIESKWAPILKDDFVKLQDRPRELTQWCEQIAIALKQATKKEKDAGRSEIIINLGASSLLSLLKLVYSREKIKFPGIEI